MFNIFHYATHTVGKWEIFLKSIHEDVTEMSKNVRKKQLLYPCESESLKEIAKFVHNVVHFLDWNCRFIMYCNLKSYVLCFHFDESL